MTTYMFETERDRTEADVDSDAIFLQQDEDGDWYLSDGDGRVYFDSLAQAEAETGLEPKW